MFCRRRAARQRPLSRAESGARVNRRAPEDEALVDEAHEDQRQREPEHRRRALKSGEEGEKQKVVMLSVVDDKKTAAALGADGYILKPLDRGNLRALLERIHLSANDMLETTDAAA